MLHGGERLRQPPALAERTQPHVDAIGHAFGGHRRQHLDQLLAGALEPVAVVERTRAVALARLGKGEHQIDIGRKIQLTAAEFAEREHHQALFLPRVVARHAVARTQAVLHRRQRGAKAGFGQDRRAGEGVLDGVDTVHVTVDQAHAFGMPMAAQARGPRRRIPRRKYQRFARHIERGQQRRLGAQPIQRVIAGEQNPQATPSAPARRPPPPAPAVRPRAGVELAVQVSGKQRGRSSAQFWQKLADRGGLPRIRSGGRRGGMSAAGASARRRGADRAGVSRRIGLRRRRPFRTSVGEGSRRDASNRRITPRACARRNHRTAGCSRRPACSTSARRGRPFQRHRRGHARYHHIDRQRARVVSLPGSACRRRGARLARWPCGWLRIEVRAGAEASGRCSHRFRARGNRACRPAQRPRGCR